MYVIYLEDLMKKNRPYNILRWSARICGMLVVALFLCGTITEYIEELQRGESTSAALSTIYSEIVKYPNIYLPWVIGCSGLILALWREGLGGGISLISFIFSSFQIGFPRQFNIIIPLSIVSIPSILYLIYWWKMVHYDRK